MVDRIRERIVDVSGDPTLSLRKQWDALAAEIASLSMKLDDLASRVKTLEDQ